MKGFFQAGFVFLALWGWSPVLFAMDTDPSPSPTPNRSPIDIHYTTLGGLQYSIREVPLSRDVDLEGLIQPLGDYETMRLLKRAEASDSLGRVLGGAGFLGLATGVVGILTTSRSGQTPFWITAIGSGLLYNIGGLFRQEAQTAKFNSVQRYNRFARGEEQPLPQTPKDEKSLLDFATPVPAMDKKGKTGEK